MKNHILKLALGLLALAALGFAGYRFMQNRDNVEIQSAATSEMQDEMAQMQEKMAQVKSAAKSSRS